MARRDRHAGAGLAGGVQHGGERVHGFWYERVVGPYAALVTGEDPGVHEDLEMVRDGGLGRPRGSVSSQTQASPPSCAATMETRRSRVGSARALRSRARSAAWLALIGSRSRGGPETAPRVGGAGRGSRVGSARALRSRARSAAWLALIGSRSRGGQQTSARLGWPAWMSRIGDVLT